MTEKMVKMAKCHLAYDLELGKQEAEANLGYIVTFEFLLFICLVLVHM